MAPSRDGEIRDENVESANEDTLVIHYLQKERQTVAGTMWSQSTIISPDMTGLTHESYVSFKSSDPDGMPHACTGHRPFLFDF